MPRFNVAVKQVHDAVYTGVEAEDAADAVRKAHQMLDKGEEESFLEFSHVMSEDVWTVERAG